MFATVYSLHRQLSRRVPAVPAEDPMPAIASLKMADARRQRNEMCRLRARRNAGVILLLAGAAIFSLGGGIFQNFGNSFGFIALLSTIWINCAEYLTTLLALKSMNLTLGTLQFSADSMGWIDFSVFWKIISIILPILWVGLILFYSSHKVLSTFSAIIFGLEPDKTTRTIRPVPNRLDILDVFRTFAIVWVMANHLGGEGRVDVLERLPSSAQFKRSVHENLILGPLFGNSSLGVEIFLVLSGLLAARSWTRRRETSASFARGYACFMARRVARILPPLIVYLLFAFTTIAVLLPRFSTTMLGGCSASSIVGVLTFTNNYAETPTCLGYLWYLGLDMQLYALAPFALSLLTRWPGIGLAVGALAVCASSFWRAYHCQRYGVCDKSDVDIPFISHPDDDASKLAAVYAGLWDMYARPVTKCGPFIIGLLVGQSMDPIRNWLFGAEYPSLSTSSTISLVYSNQRQHRCIFAVATVSTIAVVYGILPQYWNPQWGSSHPYNMLYTALFCNLFAVGVTIMILGLYYDKFGLRVWRLWNVLATLSFSAYLVHMPMMYAMNAYAPLQRVEGALGLLGALPLAGAASFALAALFHAFVEVPLAALAQRVFRF